MNEGRRLSRFIFALALSLIIARTARAQFSAVVQGTVEDPGGAAVAGAIVTLADESTHVSKQTATSSEGFYHFSEIGPGRYTVTVEAKGFRKSVTQSLEVSAERPRGLDVRLEIGEVQQSIVVNGESRTNLQTEDANLAGTLSATEIEELPKFGRDPYELIRLTPGVFGDDARMGVGGSTGFPNGPGTNGGSGGPGGSNVAIFQTENQVPISANGQRVTSNDYIVDGVSVNSLQWGGAAVLTPSPESVQEMTVISNDYDATDGRSSGAHVKVVTKGGTNVFHGGGFFQYQDPGLNAYNKFNGLNSPPARDNNAFRQFGGNLGGPIVHDKLFFFFNYEGLRDNNTSFQTMWVDTPQLDSLILSSTDPNSPVATTLSASGIAPRIAQVLPSTCDTSGPNSFPVPCQNVAGGVNVGSPIGSYGAYVSDPSGGGLTTIPEFEFANVALPGRTLGDQYNGRVDYATGRSLFSVSTFLTFFNQTTADPGAQGRPMADLHSRRLNPSGFLAWIFTISPTLINDVRFNFTRFAFNDLSANSQVDWAIPRTEIQSALPLSERIRFGAAQGDTTPAIFAQNTFALRDMVTKVLTRHALRIGVEINREQDNNDYLGSGRPDVVFNWPWNFVNGTPIFEQITVDPLTGAPSGALRHYRETDYGLFLQDDWKFRPNLTFNVGLRWEYYGPPTEAHHELENIVPGPDPVTGLLDAVAVLPHKQYKSTWRNFGPRLGFAWSPGAFSGRAVLRGGFGIAYDRFDDVSYDNTRSNPPLLASYGVCCGTDTNPFVGGQIVYATGSDPRNPFSYPSIPALATPLNPATNLPEILPGFSPPSVYANPVNSPTPYIYLYSLQTEYSLPKNWVATIGYQGSSSHGLLRIKNLQYFYPDISDQLNAVFSFTPDTNADFNALLTQLQHRFSHQFLLSVQYTYSKSIDELSDEGPGFTTNQTFPTNLALERGPSDYDATHNFVTYGLWDLPILSGRHDWVGKILGGWQASGDFQFHSGFPWTPVASNSCNLLLGGVTICPIRPIAFNGGARIDHSTDAFLPTAGGTSPTFPNGSASYFTLVNGPEPPGTPLAPPGVGRNSFRGPRFSSIDMSLVKEFGLPSMRFLGEGARIQLRVNAFNLFNKLNLAPFTFGSGSTTVSFNDNPDGTPASNPQFGTALTGLAGRVVELEGRFTF
ncbi:MAG: TonB-dependent receptor [Candidatus Acidiferrales bacterium]